MIAGCCAVIWFSLSSHAVQAATLPNPRLTYCAPAGAQRETTIDVTVGGTDLEDSRELLFSHPGITAVQKTRAPRSFETEPQSIDNQFTVTVSPDVPPGAYEVRVLGRHGLSSSRLFAIGELPEVQCDLKNKTFNTAMHVDLNTIVNCAQTSGDSAQYYEFDGQAGKRVMIHC